MPFTPLHMGPGILLKSILQGSFSPMVFDCDAVQPYQLFLDNFDNGL